MRAKDFFLAVRDAEHKVKALRARMRKYQEMAGAITGMGETRIRTLDARSPTENAALRMVEAEDQMGEAATQYVDLIEQAEALIAKIENPRYRQVLELRYLCGLSWRSVADEMHYSGPKSVFAVHGWALLAAQRIMDKMA